MRVGARGGEAGEMDGVQGKALRRDVTPQGFPF